MHDWLQVNTLVNSERVDILGLNWHLINVPSISDILCHKCTIGDFAWVILYAVTTQFLSKDGRSSTVLKNKTHSKRVPTSNACIDEVKT